MNKVLQTLKLIGICTLSIAMLWSIGYIIYRVGGIRNPTIKTVEKIVEVRVEDEAPVMGRIAKCESGGKHLGVDGQVLLNANNNGSVDVGIMQINQRIWGKKATELGYNLFIEKDNKAMGLYLYKNFGTEPWIWSKPCWNK